MDQAEIEALIKNIDTRTKRIEQLLPTLATKDDLSAFATKDALEAFATHADLAFATKDDLKAFAAHADLTFATKEDVREEGERTRHHFDTVAERMKLEAKSLQAKSPETGDKPKRRSTRRDPS